MECCRGLEASKIKTRRQKKKQLTFTEIQLEECGNVVGVDGVHGEEVVVLARVEHQLQFLHTCMTTGHTVVVCM